MFSGGLSCTHQAVWGEGGSGTVQKSRQQWDVLCVQFFVCRICPTLLFVATTELPIPGAVPNLCPKASPQHHPKPPFKACPNPSWKLWRCRCHKPYLRPLPQSSVHNLVPSLMSTLSPIFLHCSDLHASQAVDNKCTLTVLLLTTALFPKSKCTQPSPCGCKLQLTFIVGSQTAVNLQIKEISKTNISSQRLESLCTLLSTHSGPIQMGKLQSGWTFLWCGARCVPKSSIILPEQAAGPCAPPEPPK